MEYLIAVDLEGVHGVVGEPYKGLLKELPDYKKAVENATDEINVAVKALFDNGASKVAVWDNHAGGGNLDFSKIDPRATEIVGARENRRRMDFAKEYNFAGILYIGYHSREGTLNGILAHTFSSSNIQYVKINGAAVGELDIDSYISQLYGIAPIFAASDDRAIEQVKEISPDIVTVITKVGTGRNSAHLKEKAVVLDEIYAGVSAATKTSARTVGIEVPFEAEVRYTRVEYAAEILERAAKENIEACYGEDAHVVTFKINAVNDLPKML